MALNASNLPTSHQFKFEDYKGAPDYFAQFLNSLNLFVDPVYQILNGGITYQNLMIPQTFQKTITAPATGDTSFNFVNPLRTTPRAVLLGNVYLQGNPSSHPSSPAVVYWHFSQGTVYIDNVTNLTASSTYVITLVVL